MRKGSLKTCVTESMRSIEMDAKNLPIVIDVTNKLKNLIKEGRSLAQKNPHNDRSMLGPEILAELDMRVTSIESIPASQHPVVETSSRDILYPLLVSSTCEKTSAAFLTNLEINKY